MAGYVLAGEPHRSSGAGERSLTSGRKAPSLPTSLSAIVPVRSRFSNQSRVTVALSDGAGVTVLSSSSVTVPVTVFVCGEVATLASKVQL